MLADKISAYLENRLSSGFRRLQQQFSTTAARIVFLFGLLLYLGARITLTGAPAFFGGYPVIADADDAYSYIESGVQTGECFWQDCTALEDLRQQLLVASDDFDTGFERQRQYQRAILYYHPLYSIVFAGLLKSGLSPETVFNSLSIIGAVLVNLSIAYLLFNAWGAGGAGIALSLLAFALLGPERGFRNIVPSHYALGFAMLGWALIIKDSRRVKWALPLCMLGMLTMHQTGMLYAAVTLGLLLLLSSWPPGKIERSAIVSSAAVFVGYLLLAQLVTRPDLTAYAPSLFFHGAWSRRQMFAAGLTRFLAEMDWWGPDFWVRSSAAALILIGILSVSPPQRRRLTSLIILLLGLLIASLFYLNPFLPGVVSDRVWLPVKFLLFGALGAGIWHWLTALLGKLAAGMQTHKKPCDVNTAISGLAVGWLLLTLVVVFFLQQTLIRNLWLNGSQYAAEVRVNTDRPYFRIDPGQPQLLLQNIQPDDYVLYMQEVPMYFYFSHGALGQHAISYSAIAGTPEQDIWLDQNSDIRYLVAQHPVMSVLGQPQVALPLSLQDRLLISSDSPFELEQLQLFVENMYSSDALVSLSGTLNGEEQLRRLLTIKAGWGEWITLEDEAGILVDQVKLAGANESSQLLISGIHLGHASTTQWPWEQGISVTLKGADESVQDLPVLHFDPAILAQGLDLNLEVLSDDSITVLAEIIR